MKINEGIELNISEFRRAVGLPQTPSGAPQHTVGALTEFSRAPLDEAPGQADKYIQFQAQMTASELKGAAAQAKKDPKKGAMKALYGLNLTLGNIASAMREDDPAFKKIFDLSLKIAKEIKL